MDESRTRALLTGIAADSEPPSGVDLGRTVVLGRRRRRRPRWVAAATAAALVLVVTVTTVVLLRPAPEKPAPVVSVPPSTAPTAFDVARTRLTPGWLPDGMVTSARALNPQEEKLTVSNGAGTILTIHVRARGVRLPLARGRTEPGPEIHGAPSTWAVGDGGVGQLRWEWAPEAFASVEAQKFPDDRAIAVRVATALRTDTEQPVALPFTVARPTGFAVSDIQDHRIRTPRVVTLTFTSDGGPVLSVEFWVSAHEPGQVPQLDANETVSGRPAMVTEDKASVFVAQILPGQDILNVMCDSERGQPAPPALRAECLRAAESFRLAGELSDPSTWSTDPVRR